jgi:hypothetical protein
MITPEKVIGVLNREKISFVLVGLHGIVGWLKEPRATQDVDVLVALKQVKKAVKALLAAFPSLQADDQEVVVRLRDKVTGDVHIDVMKPAQMPHREIFKHTKEVSDKKLKYRVPTLEMALVLKFAPMISLNRADEDKHQDAHDFILLVKNNPDIDMAKLEVMGEFVYPGGGKEIVEFVRRVRAGEKLRL